MRINYLLILFLAFLPINSVAITVGINNPRIVLDAKNNVGDPVISAHCQLDVSGIRGQNFDLVAIVMDDDGEWHKDSKGNLVKTHYKCNATYDNTTWKDIEVYLKHNELFPKSGKHTYKVYLYVYYNNKWYGRTYAGSYDLTGGSASKQVQSSNGNQPLYESHYYYTGVMNSGGQTTQTMNPLPAEHVKIYADRIQFGRNSLYRLNGTYRLNGNVYPKYEAVNAQGNNMPNKFLLRDGKALCEVTQLNILGFTTTTISFINEGFPPQSSQSIQSSPSYRSNNNTQGTSQQQNVRRKCSLCNGWGKWKIVYASQYSGAKQTYWCEQCGKYDYIHHHETCTSCGGTGYVR